MPGKLYQIPKCAVAIAREPERERELLDQLLADLRQSWTIDEPQAIVDFARLLVRNYQNADEAELTRLEEEADQGLAFFEQWRRGEA